MSYDITIMDPAGNTEAMPNLTFNLREAMDAMFYCLRKAHEHNDDVPTYWVAFLSTERMGSILTTEDTIKLHLRLAEMRRTHTHLLPVNGWGTFENIQSVLNQILEICLKHGWCGIKVYS